MAEDCQLFASSLLGCYYGLLIRIEVGILDKFQVEYVFIDILSIYKDK